MIFSRYLCDATNGAPHNPQLDRCTAREKGLRLCVSDDFCWSIIRSTSYIVRLHNMIYIILIYHNMIIHVVNPTINHPNSPCSPWFCGRILRQRPEQRFSDPAPFRWPAQSCVRWGQIWTNNIQQPQLRQIGAYYEWSTIGIFFWWVAPLVWVGCTMILDVDG